MIEVPDIVLVDLRHNMFEYIRDAKENGKFEGRTNTRISNLSKHIIGTVNKRYRLNSKGNTTTALFHIGSFRMQKMLDQEAYNKFDELRGCIDDNALFIPEMVGTTKHLEYHKHKKE